ncbi:MAG: cytochrome c3 family protein [Saprospiraceae bacterium]
MKTHRIYIVVLCAFLAVRLEAQLSPGALSNAHKELEGMTNCTQCHEIGNKVLNDKCLQCHKEIKTLIDKQEGYHASQEVRGKDCFRCHSDHHGRNFDMVRFDEKKFNHSLASYELTGAHKQIDCRKCHQTGYIADQALKKRKDTFLGLRQQCAACHTDAHQKTLGNDCAKCHTTEKFAPASKFNHDRSDFPLEGKHKSVQCLECHKKEIKNGLSFQRFADVPFKNCNSCHEDPHKDKLGTNCKECHTEVSFGVLTGLSKFNHSKTKFTLKGKHKKVECRECHQMNVLPIAIFQDRLGVKTESCNTCHKDVHEGKFGTNCAECHTEEGFRKVGNLDKFDHNRTAFVLKGKHESVDCKKCHKTASMTDPVPHNTCATCHTDYHEGQFSAHLIVPDCAACHTESGFSESNFSQEQHAKTKFPLDGAHIATPCFACHKQEAKWKFVGLGVRCVDCHKDIHNGQIAAQWYPDKACEQCHVTSSWRESHFDHKKTAFVLKGAHEKQDCRACHKPDATYPHGQFAGLPATCSHCHAEVHNRQFEVKGATNCARCHGNESWDIAKFNHDKTNFKLEGKHATVDCAGCHKPVTEKEITFVQYKYKSFECVVCHQ